MIQFLKKYYVWMILVLAILYAQINKFINRSNIAKEKKKDNIIMYCYIIVAICIGKIIHNLLKSTKEFKKTQNKVEQPLPRSQAKYYTETSSLSEFHKITKETTEKELEKLRNSKAYKDLKEKKDKNPEALLKKFSKDSFNDSACNLSDDSLSNEKKNK